MVYDNGEVNDMVYTIKKLASLAGVSIRTLHYYDQIGLLCPSRNPENGYREYDGQGLLKLQQILFFRELDISLDDIRSILQQPEFDVLNALHIHHDALQLKADRLANLIHTVEKTIQYLKGEITMTEGEYYAGFSEEQEKRYTEEARQRYDPQIVDDSVKRWNSYSMDMKNKILEETKQNIVALAANMAKGHGSPEVQAIVLAWHKNIEYFYRCSYEIAQGLGQLYVEDPAFRANYEIYDPALPEFFKQAIDIYCEGKSGFADFS
jgi:DNA-binding transcriptional MerR regulator